ECSTAEAAEEDDGVHKQAFRAQARARETSPTPTTWDRRRTAPHPERPDEARGVDTAPQGQQDGIRIAVVRRHRAPFLSNKARWWGAAGDDEGCVQESARHVRLRAAERGGGGRPGRLG